MRQIVKNEEPKSFALYRRNTKLSPTAKYDASMQKDVNKELRESLIKEQGYICCYCMKRILLQDNSSTKTKIEHFKPQSIYNGTNGKADLRLIYSNLFLACKGEEFDDNNKQCNCCDSKKLHQELHFIDLLDESIEKKIKYSSSGAIFSNSATIKDTDSNVITCIDDEINKVLNLNNQSLKKWRKEVYNKILLIIQNAEKRHKCNPTYLERLREEWYGKHEEEGKKMFKPFCMVAVYLIKKYIKKYEAIQNQS
ncbi:MAG: TIGR02646 family protein [Bacteroidales bacterium]|nr:TIGR02646 family protein [Bacteroidales bacterium]